MRDEDGPEDIGEMNRILEAFAEDHPVPTAREIIAYKNIHPRYAEEIQDLAGILLEAALHRGRAKDHIVDARDLQVVASVFTKRRRHRVRDREL